MAREPLPVPPADRQGVIGIPGMSQKLSGLAHSMPIRRMVFASPRLLRLSAGCLLLNGALLGATDAEVRRSASDEADALVRQGMAAQDHFEPKAALPFFLRAEALKPNDPFILREISKQYSDSTLGSQDAEVNRHCIEQALDYTKRAVALDPKNAVGVLSLAVCYGKLGLYADARDKVGYARMVKQYALEAIELDPSYAYAHHVLGRWNYEVAGLGRTKRFLVKLIDGGLPDASFEEAVRQLQRAVELDPNVMAHRLELGFAYLNDGRDAEARACFQQVLTMPKRELYDDECFARAHEGLARLDAAK